MLEKGQNAATGGGAPQESRLGRYELISRIADGGMAEVYLARQLGPMNFQKVVVVKKIHPNLARQKAFIGMLLDEARISALIKHPRVVDIYDLGVSSGTYFIAMEYLAGQPLSEVIARAQKRAPLDVYSTARIIGDVAEGLHAAHNLKTLAGRALELVHRDVSPSNIIVLYDGGVKLVDFGVARARGVITETDTNQMRGKVGYVSPEQIMENPVDRRSDVFSLGVVLWESLALRRLFDAESEAGKLKQILDGVPLPPSAHRPEVPYDLDKICLRALAVKPEDRFQTAAELQAALDAFLADAGFRREAGALTRFMTEAFAEERQAQDTLLREAASRKPSVVGVPRSGGDEADFDTSVRTFVRSADDIDTDIKTAKAPAARPTTESGEENPTAVAPKPALPLRPSGPALSPDARTQVSSAKPKKPPPSPAPGLRPTAPMKAMESPFDEPSSSTGTDSSIDETKPTDHGGTGKPRGKRRSTGAASTLSETVVGRPRTTTSRVLPLPAPPPRGSAPAAPGADPLMMDGEDPDIDDPDVTEVDMTGHKVFDVGVALPAAAAAAPASALGSAAASSAASSVEPAPATTSEPVTASTDVVLTSLDDSGLRVAAFHVGRRRPTKLIVGVVAVGAVVALAAVLASGGDHPRHTDPAASPIDRATYESSRPPPAFAPSEAARAIAQPKAHRPEPVPAPTPTPAATDVAPVRTKGARSDVASGGKTPRAPRTKVKSAPAESTPPAARTSADPAELYSAGAKLYLAGKLVEARARFQAALAASPRYAPAHRGLGLVYERAGLKSRAIQSLETYLKLSPHASDATSIRAHIDRLRR